MTVEHDVEVTLYCLKMDVTERKGAEATYRRD